MTTVSTIVTADSKKDGGIGHVRLEWPVTIRWNERSRSFGIGGHVGVEYAAFPNRHFLDFVLYCPGVEIVGLAPESLGMVAIDQQVMEQPLAEVLDRTLMWKNLP